MDTTVEITALLDRIRHSSQHHSYHGDFPPGHQADHRGLSIRNIFFALGLCASIAAWFSAIRSPLWLDETVSFWQISGGFWEIWHRRGSSVVYAYILWADKSLFGTNEAVLRLPSTFAMLGAVYMFYLIAREFFDFEVAMIATILFCLHPIVAFAAIDARPYAFGILIVNCAILGLLRWLKSGSMGYALLFGITAAGLLYFHILFGVILLAFIWMVIQNKRLRENKEFRSQCLIVFIGFCVLALPIIVPLVYLVKTADTHVFAAPPRFADMVRTVNAGNIALLFVGAILVDLAISRVTAPKNISTDATRTCLLLMCVPLGVLYAVSSLTALHIFIDRYKLVAIPGVMLCWGLLVQRINSKLVRLSFCIGLLAVTLNLGPWSLWNSHGYSWEYALEVADANARPDHAPLLICSDLPESNYGAMPVNAKTSKFFPSLSYYKVASPVVPLPRALNQVAISQIRNFLSTAIPAKRRFLMVFFFPSSETQAWIQRTTKDSYRANTLGIYDGVRVVEYVPIETARLSVLRRE